MKLTLIGDVHGCYKSMVALLERIPTEHNRIVFLGDIINKGPSSFEVYQYIRTHNFEALTGNHEVFCMNRMRFMDNWQSLGGTETEASIARSLNLDDEKKVQVILTEFSYFFKTWKTHLVIPTAYGKRIIVSHAGISAKLFKESGQSVVNALRTDPLRESSHVFNKKPLMKIPGCIQVIGHQPTANAPQTDGDNWYADSGCAYKDRPGMGYLSALTFDLEQDEEPIIFRQPNIEEE